MMYNAGNMSRADLFRMCFGLLLVTILGVLIGAIALGHVEEKTSYGLMPLIVAVSNLATQFATYAFAKRPGKNKDNEDK